jgi:hypothetical protein
MAEEWSNLSNVGQLSKYGHVSLPASICRRGRKRVLMLCEREFSHTYHMQTVLGLDLLPKAKMQYESMWINFLMLLS